MDRRYHYLATIQSIHDGDTVTLDIDLGFKFWWRSQSCRLLGINAPEMSTPQGAEARDQLRKWLPLNFEVFVVTQFDRDEKFGRILVTLYSDARFRPPSLNAQMVKAGMAVAYNP